MRNHWQFFLTSRQPKFTGQCKIASFCFGQLPSWGQLKWSVVQLAPHRHDTHHSLTPASLTFLHVCTPSYTHLYTHTHTHIYTLCIHSILQLHCLNDYSVTHTHTHTCPHEPSYIHKHTQSATRIRTHTICFER